MKSTITYLLLFSLLAMAQTCEDTEQSNDSSKCAYEGTVIDASGMDGCQLLIEMNDGKRLQVLSIPAGAQELEAGDHIRFDYTEAEGMAGICMAGPMVHLSCLEYESKASACPPFVLDESNLIAEDSSMGFQLLEYRTEGKMLYLKVGVSGCDDDRNFQLILSRIQTRSMPPQNPAVLSYTRQACEAYFVKELCFDLSALNGKTVLNLKNGNTTERLLYHPKD